jgi:Fe-S-cluster-containing hydrogenase component 2
MTKEVQRVEPTSRKFVSVDPAKCTGCGICEYVCASEKCEHWTPLGSRIRVMRITPMLNAAMTCKFCKDAPCIKACPEDALAQSENGVIIVDEKKCSACDWCIQACPYGGIALDPEKRIAIACDLCNGDPKCIDSCPEEALQLVSDDGTAEKTFAAALEKIPAEIERLNNLVKKKAWATMVAEAEERAKRTTQKLEAINKRKNQQEKP